MAIFDSKTCTLEIYIERYYWFNVNTWILNTGADKPLQGIVANRALTLAITLTVP